uniref:ATP-dependent DNA helicase n=1 Tax=Glycine max TaxID=3847 RepID=A0A0R0JA50_SOYBN
MWWSFLPLWIWRYRKDFHVKNIGIGNPIKSGIASLLLSGGRTVHSKFVIPVPATASSTCNIHQGSDLAKLLKVTKLIIWDEAPVCNKFCFEALDKSLKDIIRDTNSNHLPFSGKVVVFGGDFHHILSVVPKGSRFDIVHATINSSYLWNHCQVLRLTKNMRLQNNIRDGILGEPNDGYAEITIPDEFLINYYNNPLEFYNNPEYLQSRAILASTIEVIDKVNEYVMSLIPGDEIEYYSADSINKSDALQNPAFETVTPEFLNSLNTSGIPNHEMKLKVGTPIMLLRNMAQKDVLCNGTRLIISRLSAHIIEAKIIFGKNNDHKTYIPRMNMSPSESPWPFKLIRRQFPFMVSFAMSINKSQG